MKYVYILVISFVLTIIMMNKFVDEPVHERYTIHSTCTEWRITDDNLYEITCGNYSFISDKYPELGYTYTLFMDNMGTINPEDDECYNAI